MVRTGGNPWTRLWLSESGRRLWLKNLWVEVSEDGRRFLSNGSWSPIANAIERSYLEIGFDSMSSVGPNQTSPTAIRSTYNAGLHRVLASVPTNPDPAEEPGLKWLRELGEYRRRGLLWATYDLNRDPDGSYPIKALEPGEYHHGLLIVMPAGHPLLTEAPPVAALQVLTRVDIDALQILAHRVTDLWAGVFLVHELEHLENRAMGKEPRTPSRGEYLEGEVRAYSVEIAALELLTGNRYAITVNGLHRLFERSEADAADAPSWWGRYYRAVSDETDALIGCGPCLSNMEGSMRAGFHAIAIKLVMTQDLGDPVVMLATRRRIIETLYEGLGVLPA